MSQGGAVPAVTLEGVAKRYGDVVAVAGVDLQVRQGEFFAMLGPSGSGKTTAVSQYGRPILG
ncbi:MAG TPA: ATP-binding cassette domain-containing protein [Candidatus Limnocylindrales bacterium]|jgi:ABC-type Fe3+/spermidine/putrescine transport system ATPase subunit